MNTYIFDLLKNPIECLEISSNYHNTIYIYILLSFYITYIEYVMKSAMNSDPRTPEWTSDKVYNIIIYLYYIFG